MSGMNYQDFMKKVNDYLAKMSAEDLRGLLVNWASAVQPAGRPEFLERLTISWENQLDGQLEKELFEEMAAFIT